MDACEKLVLSSAYLPNIQYFSKFFLQKKILIEVADTYQKQTYRNRCRILGANGILDLVIPVKKPNGNHTLTKDILIDYDTPWQHIHWKAITSAYNSSPFFEIFEPELAPLFGIKERYLLDWNFRLLNAISEMLGTKLEYTLTENFLAAYEKKICDMRNTIHPKTRMQSTDHEFTPLPYFQVFTEKFGFTAGLSIIDLMFNEGPQAAYYCRKCTKKATKNVAFCNGTNSKLQSKIS